MSSAAGRSVLSLVVVAALLGTTAVAQLPEPPSGAEQLRDAITEAFEGHAAAPGTPERLLEEEYRDAFLAAVPPSAPQPLPTYTQTLQTVVAGAFLGADPDAAAGLTAGHRDALHAAMEGFAVALFERLPANPSAAQTVLLADLSEGFARGSAQGVDQGHLRTRLSAYLAWGNAVGDHGVGWATGQTGSMPPAPLGAQGDALQAWVRGISAGSFAGFPEATDAQLTAMEGFADALLAWGPEQVLAQTPPSMGTPLVEALGVWAEGFTEGGFNSMPPAPTAGAPALWNAWAEAVLGTAIGRLGDHSFQPTDQGRTFLRAWAEGLGAGMGDLEAAGPFADRVRSDAEAYGAGLAGAAFDFLEDAEQWPDERIVAAGAWAEALAAATQAFQPVSGAPNPEALRTWGEALAGAVADFPDAPGLAGLPVLRAWGEGAATAGVDILVRYADSWHAEEALAVLNATAQGVGDAAGLVSGDPNTDSTLVDDFAGGLVQGVLAGGDPVLLTLDAVAYLDAWVLGAAEGSTENLYADTWRKVANAGNHVHAIALAVGGPALDYAQEKARMSYVRDRVAATNDTLAEAAAWAGGLSGGLLAAVQEAANATSVPDLDDPNFFQNLSQRWTDYVEGLWLVAQDHPVGQPGLDEAAVQAFLETALLPAGWFVTFGTQDDPQVNRTYADAVDAFGQRLAEDADPEHFDEDAYVEGAKAIAGGLSGGLVPALLNVTGVAPHAQEQANVSVAWAIGTAEAILALEPPLEGYDAETWRLWVESTTFGAVTAATEGAGRQSEAIQQFANDTVLFVQNLTDAQPPTLPDRPLVRWARAYAAGFLGEVGLPPRPLVREQLDALRAWHGEVLAALGERPDVRGYPQGQAEAIALWIGAVSGAGWDFVNATRPSPDDVPDAEDLRENLSFVRDMVRHAAQLPATFQPAREHLGGVATWAVASARGFAEEAGEHLGLPTFDPDALGAWALWAVEGTLRVQENVTGPQHAILAGYADGVAEGAGDFAAHALGRVPGGPGGGAPDPLDQEEFDAFAQGILDGIFALLRDEPFDPDSPPENETYNRAHAFAFGTVRGGSAALNASARLAYTDSVPLVQAWATEVVQTGLATLFQPGDMDVEALRRYLEGVMAEGLVRATDSPNMTQYQAAMLVTWAETLANLSQDHVFNNLSGGLGGRGNDTTWRYYAEALVAAVGDFPTGPTDAQVAAWQAWGQALLAAGGNLSTAPSVESAERLRAWFEAAVTAFAGRLPAPDPSTLEGPEPEAWNAYVAAMSAWLGGFAESGLWELPRFQAPPDPNEDVAWVAFVVQDAAAQGCGALTPRTCAEAMRIAGAATGNALAELLHDEDEEEPPEFVGGGNNTNPGGDDTDPDTTGGGSSGNNTGGQGALVAALARALEENPNVDPAVLLGAATGAVQALLADPPQDPDAAERAAEAAIAAVAAQADQLQGPDPAGLAQDLAGLITQALPQVQGAPSAPGAPGAPDQAQFRQWADALVAAVLGDLGDQGIVVPSDVEARRAQLEQAMAPYLGQGPVDRLRASPHASLRVSVSDGTNSEAGAALDGTPWFQGDHEQVVDVQMPPAADAADASWALAFAPGGFAGTQGQRVPLVVVEDAYRAVIPASALASAEDGDVLELVVLRQLPSGSPLRFDNNGEPWAYRLDMDAPSFSLTTPPTPATSVWTVSWSASGEGSPITGYWIEVRRNAGPWQTLLEDTDATSVVFTGLPGSVYDFRGHAEDEAGHDSAVAQATSRLPANAPPPGTPADPAASNLAPTLALVDVLSGARRGTVQVAFGAADPNGAPPIVRVELLRPDGEAELVWSGVAGPSGVAFPLDTARLPDGTYRLHAKATDGELTTEATSRAFVLDNTAPAVLGPKPAGGPEGGVLLLVEALDVELVQVRLSPVDAPSQVQTLLLRDDGTQGDAQAGDDVYSVALYGMPEGEYRATVLARDAAGNTYERTRELYMTNTPQGGLAGQELPPPPGPSGSGGSGTGTVVTPPSPSGDIAMPMLILVGLAAAGTAAVFLLRRRKA